MLIASLFLLWMIVILLVVAVVALSRQVRAMQEGAGAVAPRAVVAVPGRAAPVVSAPTLAGDMLTIGGPSADGRAQLLLFIAPGCAASRSAVRDALALTNRTQLRLLFLGEGRAEDYADMLRQHRIRDTDIILNAQVGADFRIGTRPSAALIDAGGRLLARGAIDGRAQLEALLAHGQADAAVGQDTDAKIVALAS